MKNRINEFHPSNPKIDVYYNGEYLYSTNFYSRCKDAKTTAAGKLSGYNFGLFGKAAPENFDPKLLKAFKSKK